MSRTILYLLKKYATLSDGICRQTLVITWWRTRGNKAKRCAPFYRLISCQMILTGKPRARSWFCKDSNNEGLWMPFLVLCIWHLRAFRLKAHQFFFSFKTNVVLRSFCVCVPLFCIYFPFALNHTKSSVRHSVATDKVITLPVVFNDLS